MTAPTRQQTQKMYSPKFQKPMTENGFEWNQCYSTRVSHIIYILLFHSLDSRDHSENLTIIFNPCHQVSSLFAQLFKHLSIPQSAPKPLRIHIYLSTHNTNFKPEIVSPDAISLSVSSLSTHSLPLLVPFHDTTLFGKQKLLDNPENPFLLFRWQFEFEHFVRANWLTICFIIIATMQMKIFGMFKQGGREWAFMK